MPVSGLPNCAGKTCPWAVDTVHFIPLLLKSYSKLLVLPKASPPFHSDDPASDFIKKKTLRFPRMISTNFLFWYLQTYVSSHHLLSSGFLPIPSFLLLSLTLLVTVPSSLIFNLYVLSISFPLAMNSSSVFPVFAFLILTNTCLLNPVDVCSSYCPAHPCCVWYNLSTVFSWRVFGSEKGWSMPLGFLLLSP